MVAKKRVTLSGLAKRKANPEDLSTRAMLVKLKLRRWGAKTNDDDVAADVAVRNKSDASLGRYTKLLLKSDNLDAYRQSQRLCKRIHRRLTSPWDDGVGLLPANLYFKYTEEVGKVKQEAAKHIKAFVEEYEEQWNNGLKEYQEDLGGLFNTGDYPEPSLVSTKFGIEIRTFSIQNPDDFRVKLSGEVAEKIRKKMRQDFESDLRESMRHPIIRLHRLLNKVQSTLDDGDKIFRDSLIGNVQELVEILPELNVLDDPKVTRLVKRTEKEICGVSDMKALRKEPEYRQEVAESAKSILKSMKGLV